MKIRETVSFLFQTHHNRWRRAVGTLSNFDRIEMPDGEKVSMPSVWIAEYFTPSGVRSLYDAIHTSGWDGGRFLGMDPGGTESLTSSRSGQGQIWWRIADLTSMSAGFTSFDSQRARLPAGVQSINLVGVSIGNGLTAVVAGFNLDESVSERLNKELHAPHRSEVVKRKGERAVSQGPKAVLQYRVQSVRNDIHRELRSWMTKTLPGAFARAQYPHPLFDLILFDVADPLGRDEGKLAKNDAIRAIGVGENAVYVSRSESLPGLVLDQPSRMNWTPDISQNVWSLWGNRSAVPALTHGMGRPDVSSAGYSVGETMTEYIARSGLTALLHLMRGSASNAHDNARKLHGGTSSRDLKRLRDRTLTTSLDLARLEQDIRVYNDRRWRDREPQFYLDVAPFFKKRDEEKGLKAFRPRDLNKNERKVQKRLARELVAFDAEYREVLGTVASLGASLDSRRVQRVATWVAVVSLGVALVTLWATQKSPPDLVGSACLLGQGLGWWYC
ncbi:hypothetical protein [Cryobacterium zhongshanensis]|uniref:Uncharacterized protein n=1 Tax=Cryobacterium zhongshanensis TaxID=2928153 RepID=A0AA41UGH8_9MICO|nr:hypothetical protein [Cryobacterium zhongshanensis]MCI4657324.1 hypothetical protein [Cryobacterium zhongshanensis]